MKIIIRPFQPGTDSGFIYSTLPKSIYYGSHIKIPVSRSHFFDTAYSYVQNVIADQNTRIFTACLKDDPDFIVGYAVVHGTCLEFVYVKEGFRNQKIATLLLKKHLISRRWGLK
jgi:hypothetical protein